MWCNFSVRQQNSCLNEEFSCCVSFCALVCPPLVVGPSPSFGNCISVFKFALQSCLVFGSKCRCVSQQYPGALDYLTLLLFLSSHNGATVILSFMINMKMIHDKRGLGEIWLRPRISNDKSVHTLLCHSFCLELFRIPQGSLRYVTYKKWV